MNKSSDKKINIIDKIKKSKKAQYLLVGVILLIITAVFLVSFFKKNVSAQSVDDVNSYVNNLESRLSYSLSQVKGVGKVSVLIKVDGGMKTVIATKTVRTEIGGKVEIEETPVLVNGKTVTLKEIYPEIIGVIIVAEGADSISVMRKIQEAVLSFLDIDLNKIEILSMK